MPRLRTFFGLAAIVLLPVLIVGVVITRDAAILLALVLDVSVALRFGLERQRYRGRAAAGSSWRPDISRRPGQVAGCRPCEGWRLTALFAVQRRPQPSRVRRSKEGTRVSA